MKSIATAEVPSKRKPSVGSGSDTQFDQSCVLDPEAIDDVSALSNDTVLNFITTSNANLAAVDSLLEENDAIFAKINGLLAQYDHVSKGTSEFADESSKLIEKKDKYAATIDEIDLILAMFEPLDSITRSLSRPGYSLIRKQKFLDILAQLDQLLEFLAAHPDYKEHAFYQVRFRQCCTRALTLIRNYLIEDIKSFGTQMSSNLASATKTVTSDVFLYTDFTNHAQDARYGELLLQISSRIPTHSEYTGLLDDVLLVYFKVRLEFVGNNAHVPVESGDLVQFCQNEISHYKKTVEKEFSTFAKVFGLSEHCTKLLHQYLKSVIEPLYDVVRNKVLRETNISTLCQLTILLQKYYEFDDTESVASYSPSSQINYGELLEPILHDVQNRIIFRIQIYIDDKLMAYKPRPEDLKIGNRKASEKQSDSSLDADFPDNLFPNMYPPLGKALTILSNIYELVNSVVFDDLAHYIVHSCISILKDGAYKLAVSHLGPMDANLYYLKNLIVLQSQLSNFDIQYVRTETSLDFTSGINEIIAMIRAGEVMYNINQLGIIELVKKSVPKVINNMIDAKHEIEHELNNAVHGFITECANRISSPLQNGNVDAIPTFRDNLLTELPSIHHEIGLFIADEAIVKYLMNNLAGLLVSAYEKYYELLERHTDDVMEPDTLFNFVNEIVSGLDEEPRVEFNEEILKDLDLETPELHE